MILFFRSTPAFSEKLFFSTVEQGDIFTDSAMKILQQAYQCAGPYEIEVKKFPAKRALLYANMGQVDGELIRPSVPADYSNLLKVDIPLLEFALVLVSKKQSAYTTPAQLEDLNQSRTGIINGYQSTAHIPAILPNVFKARNLDHLIKMLHNQRIDFAIVIDELLEPERFQDLYKHHPPIEKRWFYHYLHKRHSRLLPALSKCLSDMKKGNQLHLIIEQKPQTFK